MIRIGKGYDIHRLVEGRLLFIGGVKIPFSKGADAHSDGDVLFHALIDALLGAEAKADIGSFFPDTDEKYRGANSFTLLSEIMKIVDVEIINIDSTIFLDGIKLAPYIPKMRENIAVALKVEEQKISVKAKTTEGFAPNAVCASVIILCEKNLR